jgi:hypothetical protein
MSLITCTRKLAQDVTHHMHKEVEVVFSCPSNASKSNSFFQFVDEWYQNVLHFVIFLMMGMDCRSESKYIFMARQATANTYTRITHTVHAVYFMSQMWCMHLGHFIFPITVVNENFHPAPCIPESMLLKYKWEWLFLSHMAKHALAPKDKVLTASNSSVMQIPGLFQ